MFCTKCGTQNGEGANYCGKCGAKLPEIRYAGQQQSTKAAGQNEQQKQNAVLNHANQQKNANIKKKKKAKQIAIVSAVCVLLVAFLAAGFFVLKERKAEKQFADAMDRGYKYLENLDYERAEAEFLKAVAVAPKAAEPYTALADVYLAQDDPEKALEILKRAKDIVPEEEQSSKIKNIKQEENEDISEEAAHEQKESSSLKTSSGKQKKADSQAGSSKQKSITQKLEEVKGLEKYVWAVEPVIEADNIYYLPVDNTNVDCVNDIHKQFVTDYAVIRREDAYSLIGTDGKLVDDMIYKAIRRFAGTYILDRAEEKYEPEYEQMWRAYSLKNGKIAPISGLGSGGPQNEYYYCGGLHNLLQIYGGASYNTYREEPENPIPVQRTEKIYTKSGEADMYNFVTEGLPFAVYVDGELATDFEYEEMGSWSNGLIAVKKSGKWGYLNEQGETVIPIEYDASWNYLDWDGTDVETVYAALGGYVPLCKDGVWELRNTEGRLMIMPGVFEQICPVYKGKCWVKRDGKWGIIEIGKDKTVDSKEDAEEILEESMEMPDYEAAYAPIIQNVLQEYGQYNIYYRCDIDKDGVDELLVREGTCEADYIYQVYTIQNGESVFVGEVPGGHVCFYEENGGKEPYIYSVLAHMGTEVISVVRLEDRQVTVEEQYRKVLEPEEEYFSTDSLVPFARVDDLSLLK